MKTTSHQSGQALVIIVFVILGLFGITALAVDGGMAYSDRRKAQNAADSAALAAALADIRGRDIDATARSTAAIDGFDGKGSNTVTVTSAKAPSGSCLNAPVVKDITVQITSVLNTYFAPVIGIQQMKNTVTATARACEPSVGPLFNGNAIVALTNSGVGFSGVGNTDWTVTGGGIFSNSSDNPSAECKGATNLSAPSMTTVGNTNLKCDNTIGQETTGAAQLSYNDYSSLLPPVPTCNGHAKKQGSYWVAEPGTDGSQVAFSGPMQFGPGLYCVTNSPGPYHDKITGTGVTFYLVPSDFSIKFAGGGNSGGPNCNGKGNGGGNNSGGGASLGAPLAAPTSGDYAGVLIFSKAYLGTGGVLRQTQDIDLRGNGSGIISGSIIVPSASVTMYGNSSGTGYQTQIIAYSVYARGCANVNINYNAKGGFQAQYPALLTLLR